MKYNYFLGIFLSIIFPGFIQYYIKEHSKANKYIILYFSSFMILFIILIINGNFIDINDIKAIAENKLLIELSFIINISFRLISGIDGLIQIRTHNVHYG